MPSYRKSLVAFTSIVEPMTFHEVSKDPLWIEAMEIELKALEDNKANGDIERYKVRLVAKEYSQHEGLDYNETFLPVVKIVTVRAMMSIAAIEGWHLHQMYVYNAFLQGDLYDEVYMKLPQGFTSQGGEEWSMQACQILV